LNVPVTDIPIQYHQFKAEFDLAVNRVFQSGFFIGGEEIREFEKQLSAFLHMRHVIGCANGTDALQLALMALNLPRGSRVIVPAFTYIAPVEVIRFLGYEPVYCDVDAETFNCTAEMIAAVYTPDVKAIIPVHLFGQRCDMAPISAWAEQHHCFVIEDNAQSIAAEKELSGSRSVITTSFFPTKNLGGYGDGGAVLTNDTVIAEKIRQLANHGQGAQKYIHDIVGINSRLDALQAAILQVKLKHLDACILKRKKAAAFYDQALSGLGAVSIPKKAGEHTYHQYSIRADEKHRDGLQKFLTEMGIPTSIFYPMPAYRQQAYRQEKIELPNAEQLCKTVLSLPMHTALDESTLSYICESIHAYFKK
jgi:dTDP-4-amino-4,6-dideoxygalactose transaminase